MNDVEFVVRKHEGGVCSYCWLKAEWIQYYSCDGVKWTSLSCHHHNNAKHHDPLDGNCVRCGLPNPDRICIYCRREIEGKRVYNPVTREFFNALALMFEKTPYTQPAVRRNKSEEEAA